MRRAHRLALALASAAFLFASATQAADGIKASATVSRDVPADIVVVSFQITERAVLSDGISDSRLILARALEEKGLKVLEKSTRYQAITGAYGASPVNVIMSAGSGRDPIEVRKNVVFRVTGFKRIDDVLDVVARHGVRANVNLVADHSKADAVREELQKEAVESAVAQARGLAVKAGVKAGGVVDLATQPGHTPFGVLSVGPHGTAFPPSATPDQALIDPPQLGDMLRIRFSVTASVVLAVKSD